MVESVQVPSQYHLPTTIGAQLINQDWIMRQPGAQMPQPISGCRFTFHTWPWSPRLQHKDTRYRLKLRQNIHLSDSSHISLSFCRLLTIGQRVTVCCTVWTGSTGTDTDTQMVTYGYFVFFSSHGLPSFFSFNFLTHFLFLFLQVFSANADRNSIVIHKLHNPIEARYVRFVPMTWHNHPAMRLEVYGCHASKLMLYHCFNQILHKLRCSIIIE